MIRRTVLTSVIVAVGLLGSPRGARAHEGHEHKVMGTVTMAAADHVMVKDTDGKDVTVYLKTDTKIVRGKTNVKAADIKTNMRVVITAVTEKDKDREKMVAKSIQLGEATAAQ